MNVLKNLHVLLKSYFFYFIYILFFDEINYNKDLLRFCYCIVLKLATQR